MLMTFPPLASHIDYMAVGQRLNHLIGVESQAAAGLDEWNTTKVHPL
jgi:hypothetical protein